MNLTVMRDAKDGRPVHGPRPDVRKVLARIHKTMPGVCIDDLAPALFLEERYPGSPYSYWIEAWALKEPPGADVEMPDVILYFFRQDEKIRLYIVRPGVDTWAIDEEVAA